jgi:hypothetical protein
LHAEQKILKSQAILALERLAMELARPGFTRNLIGDENVEVQEGDEDVSKQLNDMRFSSAA